MGTGHCLNGQKTQLICLRSEPRPVLVLCCLIYAPSLYGGLMWVCSSMHRQGQHHCSIFTSMVRPGERSSRREKHFSQKKINYLPSPDITRHHPTSPHITSPCQWWMDSAARSSLDIYITTRCGLLLLVRCVFCSVLCTLIISTSSMCHPTNVPTVPISPVFACSELRS